MAKSYPLPSFITHLEKFERQGFLSSTSRKEIMDVFTTDEGVELKNPREKIEEILFKNDDPIQDARSILKFENENLFQAIEDIFIGGYETRYTCEKKKNTETHSCYINKLTHTFSLKRNSENGNIEKVVLRRYGKKVDNWGTQNIDETLLDSDNITDGHIEGMQIVIKNLSKIKHTLPARKQKMLEAFQDIFMKEDQLEEEYVEYVELE